MGTYILYVFLRDGVRSYCVFRLADHGTSQLVSGVVDVALSDGVSMVFCASGLGRREH